MAEVIQGDYDQLSDLASKFSDEAQTIQELLQTVRSGVQDLEDGGWIGMGASAFFDEMNSLVIPGVTRLIIALNESSDVTKQISQKLHEAEDQAGKLFC